MMKNKIKKWLVIAIITPLLIIGCTKEWLDKVELTGANVEDVYFNSIGGISQLVTGTYAAINPVAAGIQNLDIMYLAYGSFASDEAEAGGEPTGADIVDFQNWDKGIPQPSETKAETDNNWAYNYKCIQRANLTLKGIEKYRTDHGDMAADSAAILNQYEGEIRFIRAFIHFKLTQIYGGIPIVDHILGSTEYNAVRNTVAECLQFEQEELIKAIDLLPLKNQYSTADVGRVTKGAAQSLLAKAYLYESSYAENYAGDARFEGCTNKYAQALVQAQAVINSNQYTLVGINGEKFDTYWNQDGSTIYPDGYTPGYRYIFTVDGEHSDECIFSTEAINDQGNYLLSRGSYLNIYMACRLTGRPVPSALGWGFNCPTEELLNAYDAGDPRKIVTIAEDWDPVYLASGWDNLNCGNSPTNMHTRKYEASPAQYWGTRNTDGNGPTNFPYIRYADVVLMAAEAAFKTGDAATALTYVNQVRTRARNGAATGVPANLNAVTFDDIIKERQLELACEGHRFFDLVRWKKAAEVLIDQPIRKYRYDTELYMAVPQTPEFVNQFTPGLNEFFPIPLTEIINTNYSLVQYPGYQ